MKKQAFSLVELSIVLVILGLLTGGILAGESLIHAAELRAITTEYNRYYSAMNAFRDKYFQLPGDMNNAVSFWGAADGSTGNTAACATTQGTGTQTCNGNGDNQILASTASEERTRFWQHLANAGLIEGNYTGILSSGNMVGGTNVPPSKLGGAAAWGISCLGNVTGSAYLPDGSYGNAFNFVTRPAAMGAISPPDVWNIDSKMDDGKPVTGKLRASWGTPYSTATPATACTTAATSADTTATYNLSDNNKDCAVWIVTGF